MVEIVPFRSFLLAITVSVGAALVDITYTSLLYFQTVVTKFHFCRNQWSPLSKSSITKIQVTFIVYLFSIVIHVINSYMYNCIHCASRVTQRTCSFVSYSCYIPNCMVVLALGKPFLFSNL